MEELTIGETARRAGLRPSALRYYERVGLLPAPRRANGRRRYDLSALERLAVIRLAQQAGFTIAETQRLLHGFAPDTPAGARWRPLSRQKIAELDAQIARAERMKLMLAELVRCECVRLEECVASGE